MTATPGQAAWSAHDRARGATGSQHTWSFVEPRERDIWEGIAQAATDAATEGSLRACGYTLADIARFLEAEVAAQEPHAAPGLTVATFGYNGCLTPDAVYATHIGTVGLSVTVDYGRELGIDEDGAEKLDAELHAALERLLAPWFGAVTVGPPQPAPELVTADYREEVGRLVVDRARCAEALQRIVDAVAAGDAAAVDKLARNALGLTRVGRPAPFQPAPELPGGSTSPDARPRADGRPGLDITCGSCGEDYGTNVPDPDEIECPECEARRCPNCQAWFGGSKW